MPLLHYGDYGVLNLPADDFVSLICFITYGVFGFLVKKSICYEDYGSFGMFAGLTN